MNILFLNAGRRCELIDAFRKALRIRGGGLIFGSDISEFAPALYAVDHPVIFPHSGDDLFVERLCSFCNQYEITLLIPTIDPDLFHLDNLRDQIAERCPNLRILLSPSYTIHHSRDKRLSRSLFAELP